MKQLINVKYISSYGDNKLYTVYISRFYENFNDRRKCDPLFHFFYIFYISSSWVLILYKSIKNWCYKQIKLTPWRCVHFDFVPNFQCWWRDFERTGVMHHLVGCSNVYLKIIVKYEDDHHIRDPSTRDLDFPIFSIIDFKFWHVHFRLCRSVSF